MSGKTPPNLPAFDEKLLNHLRQQTQMRPLLIQMAGIHACETGNTIGLAQWTIDTLLLKTIERERDYLRKNCPTTVPFNCLERAVAILTFTGPVQVTSTEWMRLLEEDNNVCGFPGCQPGMVCNAAKDLLGLDGGNISPIGPDIIAEAFSVVVIKENEDRVQDLLSSIIAVSGKEAWSRLLRSVIDLYHISSLSCIEVWVIKLIPERSANELLQVEKLLEKISIAQNRLETKVYETLLSLLKNDESVDDERARILNNFSTCLSDTGQREDALKAALKAVEIYEKLAGKNPDAFEPDLAMSYNNLGNMYSDLGQREDALKAALKAVEIREKLAGKNPDAFEPNLAVSYNNLGTMYSDLGQREDALKAALKAVEIYEKLAGKNPDAFEPDLAMSYNNLGNMYSDLGQREDALKAALKAVEIYEKLAGKNPDAFEPDLAMSYNNLGNRYSYLGQREDALKAALKAVEIREKLAGKNPDAFEPDLAMSYNNLGNMYSDLGQREDALKAALKAVEIREKLAGKNPDAFEPNLAVSYNNLGTMYSYLGQREDALKAALKAVEIYEKLAGKNPDAFEPVLAMSFGSKGAILSNGEDISGAAESFFMGVVKLRRLFLAQPGPYARIMGNLCQDYITACEKLKIAPDMETLSEIIEVFKCLYQ